MKGSAWRTEFQNASVVWPDSVLPDASVIVPEIITGIFVSSASNALLIAKMAAFRVQRVEYRFDHQEVDAALNQRNSGLLVGFSELRERNAAKARVVYIRRHRRGAVSRDRERRQRILVSPCSAEYFVCRFARDLRRSQVYFRDQRLHPIVTHGWCIGVKRVWFL